MPRNSWRLLPVVLVALLGRTSAAQAEPEEVVRLSDQVLRETLAIPGKEIPESLLTQAHGVAIIPNVIKIGFVAGVRRGHGVVLVRDAEGEWSLPQFITLTGGSVGWQAGIQGSDVVLVFMTQRSIEGLMQGKFTIGADASASAGPVGRNASAATDGKLQAEILSYSRSRGLFAGVALDGTELRVDGASYLTYYGAPIGQPPAQLPVSASRLREDLAALSAGQPLPAAPTLAMPAPVDATTVGAAAPSRLIALRNTLKTNATRLNAILDANWRQFLALPREVWEGEQPPSAASLQAAEQHYAQIAAQPQYAALAARPEFQATYQALREFTQEVSAVAAQPISLPPPPAGS